MSLFLNFHGIHCDYLDVPGKTFDYAAWRMARHGFSITKYDATSQTACPPSGTYDGIIAWDVLEHLFKLEEAIDGIARCLREDGWLMSKSTFAHGDDHEEYIHLTKHACYSDIRQFNQLMVQRGFRYQGQLKPNRFSRLLKCCGLRYAVAGVMIVPRLKHGGNFLVHTLG